MTAELIDRKRLKEEVRELLSGAQVSPKAMTALYGLLLLFLNMVSAFAGDAGVLSTFVSILTGLLSIVLGAGFTLYCMAIRRNERAEYLTLFDGFSFVGKLIALTIVTYAFIWLWSMLFIIPGIIAAYRYRFAPYNLYENPGISVMEALDMSKRQTMGYKGQIFTLDLSYLGWTLLASLPVMAETGMMYYGLLSSAYTYMSGAAASTAADLTVYTALPAWLWTLIAGLWSTAVSLFYLPNYHCVELEYFETAKRTSGVGEGAEPSAINAWGGSGPDGLGGL
ncbi:DUF975 family protein [Oscillibacter valericigenes]|uniref:DUF975 family protein n=1 Tax=Oscillibacter valericigenes TaxID=351091 RepID=UPI001F1AAEE5|nr:DUF975 family protein [Oscillibacter valericigenes]MCF2617026.1 DUF975 family protein [Oscillibacter valericigenes]